MNKKRSAPAAEAANTSASKKRKMEQKYYAVKAGFNPGVYLTYAECQKQTSGFRGAVFKSFTSREDAEAFAAGKKVASPSNAPERFYAVAVGNPTGIYTDWADASVAIKGVKGPKYKKFDTRSAAVAFIKQFGNRETIEALGEVADDHQEAPATKSRPDPLKSQQLLQRDDVLVIYTDGSSLRNGAKGARAGVGVYFGPNDPRNISERLGGEPQTNQRAELTAILRALQVAPIDKAVQICTDSQYSINCVTQWAPGWAKKGWKTANGADVKNQDIIREVVAWMDRRTEASADTFYQWVKGHATDERNVAADRLAVRGANLASPETSESSDAESDSD